MLLDGETVEVHGIGFAGVKGFAGGFGRGVLGPWGEEVVKRFVHEAVNEALKLESALARLRTPTRDRAPPLRADCRNRRGRAARDLALSRLQPARRAALALPGDGGLPWPCASRHGRRQDVERHAGLQRLAAAAAGAQSRSSPARARRRRCTAADVTTHESHDHRQDRHDPLGLTRRVTFDADAARAIPIACCRANGS